MECNKKLTDVKYFNEGIVSQIKKSILQKFAIFTV